MAAFGFTPACADSVTQKLEPKKDRKEWKRQLQRSACFKDDINAALESGMRNIFIPCVDTVLQTRSCMCVPVYQHVHCCSGGDDCPKPSKIPSRIVPVSRPLGNDNSSIPCLQGTLHLPMLLFTLSWLCMVLGSVSRLSLL